MVSLLPIIHPPNLEMIAKGSTTTWMKNTQGLISRLNPRLSGLLMMQREYNTFLSHGTHAIPSIQAISNARKYNGPRIAHLWCAVIQALHRQLITGFTRRTITPSYLEALLS